MIGGFCLACVMATSMLTLHLGSCAIGPCVDVGGGAVDGDDGGLDGEKYVRPVVIVAACLTQCGGMVQRNGRFRAGATPTHHVFGHGLVASCPSCA